MRTLPSDTTVLSANAEPVQTKGDNHFSHLLEQEEITFKEVEYYLQAGEPTWPHGWILHLSVISQQISSLLRTILPMLKEQGVAFRVVKDTETAKSILNGNMGLVQLGKVMAIYPENDSQALTIAQQLISITKGYKGPDILTDRHLGGTVYARYGCIGTITNGKDKQGNELYFYDNNTQVSPWHYSIPFELPSNIHWPFGIIASPNALQTDPLPANKVKATGVLKEDARGNVLQGLFLEKWWKIRQCVIKEGKYAMVTDDAGRDIQHRLEWQYHLHSTLYGKVPIPKVYAYLKEERNHYLVIESIKGRSLDLVIKDIFADRPWADLDKKDQLRLIEFALQLLNIVNAYHSNGYVHRDINPGNFLVKKDGTIVLIDLELSYSIRQQMPDPPFRYGTSWFMSPEQMRIETPTAQEDIYAVGATLLSIFTGLLPSKFSTETIATGIEQLQFFIQDENLSLLILQCFNDDPSERPLLPTLRSSVQAFKERTQSEVQAKASRQTFIPSAEEIQQLLEESINSLASETFTAKNGLWFSKTIQQPDYAYYQMDECSIYPGLGIGVSGVLSLLSQLHMFSISIRSCIPSYQEGLSYVLTADIKQPEVGNGLYTGSAGIALALATALQASLVKDAEAVRKKILSHLGNINSNDHNIAAGTAGQIIAAIQCNKKVPNLELRKAIEAKVLLLQQTQQTDGSWISGNGENAQKIFGFGHGAAGTIYSLLCYAEYFKDETVLPAARKGLEWLMKYRYKKGNLYRWLYSDRNKNMFPGFNEGFAGIAFVFIKAYQVLKDVRYKQVAEGVLLNFPVHLSARDLSFGSGAAGIGELYLEAFKTFNDQRWKERADWIATFLIHQCKRKKGASAYWIIDESHTTTADLLTGNSGVSYYILGYLTQESPSHPFLV